MKGATHKQLRQGALDRSAIVQRNRKAAATRKKLKVTRVKVLKEAYPLGDELAAAQPGTAKGDYSIAEILERLNARKPAR